MGLKLQDLPVKLLSRLQSLERWDLSRNRLQEFPKNLELPALRSLDLSDNQMEDVTTLQPLGGLEELKMDDNLYITVRTRPTASYHFSISKSKCDLTNIRLFFYSFVGE